jgi:hypothetical protein
MDQVVSFWILKLNPNPCTTLIHGKENIQELVWYPVVVQNNLLLELSGPSLVFCCDKIIQGFSNKLKGQTRKEKKTVHLYRLQ